MEDLVLGLTFAALSKSKRFLIQINLKLFFKGTESRHKFECFNPFIFAIRCRRPLITMITVRLINPSLIY